MYASMEMFHLDGTDLSWLSLNFVNGSQMIHHFLPCNLPGNYEQACLDTSTQPHETCCFTIILYYTFIRIPRHLATLYRVDTHILLIV